MLCAFDKFGIIPQISTLPLSKYKFLRQQYTSDKFQCSSQKLKGNKDIPDDWAICETENPIDMQEKDQIQQIQGYESNHSTLKFCIKCMFKWRNFDFDPSLDYTKKEFNKQHAKDKVFEPIEVDPTHIVNKMFNKSGVEIFEDAKNKYIQKMAKN